MLLNNRYQVLQTLGSGGFGETFLAEDTQMPSLRRCVIKQLKPIASNPQVYQLVQERFGREAAVLEKLGENNDQIPSLYAYFQFKERFYLVQEYVEGETLTTIIQKQEFLPENEVREILASLLPVLEYVHNQKIIHRDIKPENIILRHRDNKAVLIDFGAVREIMGTVINSQGNAARSIIIGTPGYMSSEQAAGRPVYSSDLYSLGMTAIYLLTGKKPQELHVNPITGELVWHDYAVGISPAMIGVIDKVTQYHPRDRFSTAGEMLKALESDFVPLDPTVHYVREPVDTQPPSFAVSSSSVSPNIVKQDLFSTTNISSTNKSDVGESKKNLILGLVIGSSILGVFIGASVIVGFMLNRSSQVVEPKISTSIQQPNKIQQPDTIQQSNTIQQPDTIQKPNTESQISETPKPPIDNYSWLSQRLAKNADLDDKSALDLDIMRNSVFARHGYRFKTIKLQEYFDKQPWYKPKYLPQDFPDNLLSDIEIQNVEFIAKYQDSNNKRYFPK